MSSARSPLGHMLLCPHCSYHNFTNLDATIFMRDNATEVLEGVGSAIVEVCIILDDLPSGGLDCNITAELATINVTASK